MNALAQLSPQTLTAMLAEGGTTTGPVTNVAVEPLSVSGAVCDLARLLLTYDPSAQSAGPPSMVAKLHKTDPEIQALGRAIGLYEREFRFYSQFSGRVMGRVPLCFFVGDGDIGDRPLLLEDLTAFRAVDQIVGFSLQETEQVIDHLARMHAGFWDSPELLDPQLGWLSALDQPAFVKGLAGAVAGAVEPFQARYADRLPSDAFRAALRAAEDTVEVLIACSGGPYTLVHFDPRADNWLFDDDCSPCLLDWQAVGRVRGLHDVAYVLCGSVPPDIQEQHWEALLRRYHEGLTRYGISGYPWLDCREHYRQHVAAVTLLMLPMIGLIKSERGEQLADAIIGRCVPHAFAIGAFG